MFGLQTPVIIISPNAERDQGKKARLTNIQAGKNVSQIIRSTLGPKSMLKMLLDPMGGIVLTNDGNAILREVDVAHPAAKTMIDLSRAQDEEVGDGTTTVVIIAGELLSISEAFVERNELHPTIIVSGYLKALDDILEIMESVAYTLDLNDDEALRNVITGCIGTKFSSHWGSKVSSMALKAARIVAVEKHVGRLEIDTKRYVRVEKIPGGDFDQCEVLTGVMMNKDVTHAKMKRHIKHPKVALLDCPLEYKKNESQTIMEITQEDQWSKLLAQEEQEVRKMCDHIIETGCNVVVTEKGVSDLAAHFLMKAGISVIRRIKKTENNRLARVTGATIVTRPEELTPQDIGHDCKLFKVQTIGDEYFSYFIECDNPHACTVILRGASKDVLNEIERNFYDALSVSRNIFMSPKLVPGGGAVEMEIAARLTERSKGIESLIQWPYRAVATALEIIPRTLAENSGADVVRTLTDLRARHASGGADGVYWGIDGNYGTVSDMRTLNMWDAFVVKQQAIKTAVESAAMILRIDDVLSGIGKKKDAESE